MKWALQLLVLIAVALFAWWMVQGTDQSTDATVTDGAEAVVAATNAPAESLAANAPENAAHIATVPFHERTADLPVETLIEGCVLWVRERTTLAAVPNAIVHLYDMGALNHHKLQAALLERVDLEGALQMRPRRFRADASGRLLIAVPRNGGVVTALTNTHWGVSGIDPIAQHEDYEVLVDPDLPVTLRALLADGTPAAHALIAVAPEGKTREPLYFAWRSDAAGCVTIPSIGPIWVAAGRRPLVFFASGFPHFVTSAALDPTKPPAGALDITMPSFGALRVTVTGLDALPADLQRQVRVQIRHTFLGGGAQQDWMPAAVVQGVATFSYVPVQTRLVLRFATPSADIRATETMIDGPESAGATRETTVALPPLNPILMAKLVDERGAPLANARVKSSIEFPDHNLQRGDWTTNSEGVLRCSVIPPKTAQAEALPPGRTAQWHVRTERTPPEQPDATPMALHLHFPLPPTLADGINDCGTLIMLTPPVVAAGVVVDELGAPVIAATVTGYGRTRNAAGNVKPSNEQANAMTDNEGRFELREFVDAPELELKVRKAGISDVNSSIVPCGATGLTLSVNRAATLRGRVLLPEGVRPAAIEVRMESADMALPMGAGRALKRSRLRADGSFSCGPLAPGRWTLNVGDFMSARQPFAAFTGLNILAETKSLPELDPLDLRGLIHSIDIDVRGANGQPLPSANVHTAEDLEGRGTNTDPEGRATLVLHKLPVDLVITGQNHRALELKGVSASRQVQLPPGIRVRLRCSSTAEVPSPLHIRVILEALPPSSSARRTYGAVLQDEGDLEYQLPEPGNYKIHAVLVDRNPLARNERPLPISVVGLREIAVTDSPTVQLFVVTPDPESLQKALQRKIP